MTRLPDSHQTEHEPDVTESTIPEPDDGFTVISNLLPTAEMCKVKTSDRIIGGKKATETEFPWMVLLEYNKRIYEMLFL